MICFCDCEVYQIEEEKFTRSKLLLYILENHLQNILFQIVNKDSIVIGTVQYSDIVGKSCTLEACIQTEKIFFNEDVFGNVRNEIDKKRENGEPCKFVPVYDETGQIIYAAYDMYKDVHWIMKDMETLKSL